MGEIKDWMKKNMQTHSYMDTYACTDHPNQSQGGVFANVEGSREINRMCVCVCV